VAKQRRGMSSPRGMVQIGPPRKGEAKLVFRDGVARLPDPEPEIREAIRNMRRDAQKVINPEQAARIISDKEKAGSADAAYFAALLHEQLARVEDCLRQLLTCPAADARWRGLMLARELDTSRFYWQRLLLIKSEKFTVAGLASSDSGIKGNKEKQRAAQQNAEQVRAYFRERTIPRGEMEAAVTNAMAKFGLSRARIFAIKKEV
jgi:hypothetical protein